MADCKENVKLPQAGTSAYAGKSRPPTGGCPSYSGGGNNRLIIKFNKTDLGKTLDNDDISKVDEALTGPQTGDTLQMDSDLEGIREANVFISPCELSKEGVALATRVRASESDTDSVMSTETADGIRYSRLAKFWRKEESTRKRKNDETLSDAESAAGEEQSEYTQLARKSKGQYSTNSGAKSKAVRKTVCKEDFKVSSEIDITEAAQKMRSASASRLADLRVNDPDTKTASDLTEMVLKSVDLVQTIAKKSGNLKGTSVRDLNQAAAIIKNAVLELVQHSTSDETRLLKAENVRLKQEMRELRQEVTQMKDEMKKACWQDCPLPSSYQTDSEMVRPSTSGDDDREREIMVKIGNMMNARLEAIEDRLLPAKRIRPPLAADKRNEKRNKSPIVSTPSPKVKHKENEKTGGGFGATQADLLTSQRLLQPASTSTEPVWTLVSGKRRRKRKKNVTTIPASSQQPLQTRTPQHQRKSTFSPKLRPPRSSAVVITIQQTGVSYAEVLAEAKRKINLNDLGISGLRLRQAATGARILEVPGATSGVRADELAKKLREVLPPEMARVSRPVKCAEMRISGLDDSVSPGEVASAVSRVGGCTVDSIKHGEIKQDFNGLGALWLRCPIVAAKKVAANGRLLVGWVAAQVKLFAPKALSCYRCLEFGHVKQQCRSEVDRSDQCYRCGKVGHIAKQCLSEPHCSICAAASKPAGHRVGNKNCYALKTTRYGNRAGFGSKSLTQTINPASSQEEAVSMTTE